MDFNKLVHAILDFCSETLKYWFKSTLKMAGFDTGEKYGNKNDKSSLQVTLIRVLFAILIIAFIVLVIRLSYIVTVNGEEYKRQVYSQRQTTDEIIPYERGSIYDCKGTVLASNIKKYIVVLDAKQVKDYADNKGNDSYIYATADALSTYLGYDRQEIIDFILANPDDAYERISKDENGKTIALDSETVQPLMDAIAESRKNSGENIAIYGINFEDAYERYYPNNSLACDVLGYVINDENKGLYGLEQYYNDILNGENGRSFGYINDYTNLEREIIPAKDGCSLMLNIDSTIQRIVEEKIVKVNESMDYEDRPGSYNTGVIIMESDTGKVLAMAGYPFYDLNDPKSVTIDKYFHESQIEELLSDCAKTEGYIDGVTSNIFFDRGDIPYLKVLNEETGKDEIVELSTDQLDTLDNDLSAYVRNLIWKNFCISDTYEPGSVAKTITTAIGLDSGKIDLGKKYSCGGSIVILGEEIRCSHWRTGGCGAGTLRESLAKSCNPAFTSIGSDIGRTTFYEYTREFYGVKTGIDLTGEANTKNLVYTEDRLNKVELATASFGQGFNVTMIQMICAFNSLINDGQYLEPHIVGKILDGDGAVVENIEPRVLKQTVSETTSATLRDYCIGVVEDEGGTGKNARPAGYRIGGKTGTAEISKGTSGYVAGQYVVSFMSFAPADDPQIVMYVVIDRPNIADQSAGAVNQACELTRDIYTEILPYLNIPMTEEISEKEQAELDEKGIYSSKTVTEETGEEGNTEENEETDNE